MDDNLKEEIRKAVREVVVEEVKSVVKEQVPKKGSVKSKIQWDTTRESGMDARDPRQA